MGDSNILQFFDGLTRRLSRKELKHIKHSTLYSNTIDSLNNVKYITK